MEAYLDSLLTYGRAIGEMVVSQGKLVAVCWGDVTRVHVQQSDSPLELTLGTYEKGQFRAFPQQKLLLFSTWNPDAENPYGASLLRSMPFLTDVLMKIYKTIGINWERAGNVRYSVVYRPKDERAESSAAAEQMAREWTAAMQDGRSGAVRDFVAVGDVEIKVIGADGKIFGDAGTADFGAACRKNGAAAVYAGAELGLDRADVQAAGGSADLGAVGHPALRAAGLAADLRDVAAAERLRL